MNVDSFELNKIAGALLFALLIFFGARTVSNIIIDAPAPAIPGYDVAVTEPETATEEAEEEEVPLATLLQDASAERGEAQAKKCVACHTFEQGGANKVGPHLYDVLGRDIASVEGFAYSPALQDLEGTWDYERVNDFVADPRGFAPGTKMAFAGLRNAKQRADLLLYLREHAESPPPLPEAPAQESEDQPAAKEGEEAANGQAPDDAQPSGETGDAKQQPAETSSEQQPAGAGEQEQAPQDQPQASEQMPERSNQAGEPASDTPARTDAPSSQDAPSPQEAPEQEPERPQPN